MPRNPLSSNFSANAFGHLVISHGLFQAAFSGTSDALQHGRCLSTWAYAGASPCLDGLTLGCWRACPEEQKKASLLLQKAKLSADSSLAKKYY